MSSPPSPPTADHEVAEIDQEALNRLLDLEDAQSIMSFGASAQRELAGVTDQMLDGVKNQDVGQAGEALNDVIATLRGFDVDALATHNERRGLLSWLFSASRPLAKFLQRYESVRGQIDAITDRLEQHKTTLLTDLTRLDRLYQGSLECFHGLEGYIAVGERRLAQVDTETLPGLQEKVDAGGEVVDAQALRDLRASRDDLERRLHDLRLTRQVTMQSLPGIRLVQENNKGLVNRINSVVTNTVPLWRQQLATAVAIYRSREATRSVEAASDLTNEMLEANARDLKVASAESRRAIERGVLDIASVKAANETLIETIEESLAIAQEGRQARAAAREELQAAEAQLRTALANAASREQTENTES
ncbi:MAG: toxic anion resistance protein [Pseudomonadota bacterium]